MLVYGKVPDRNRSVSVRSLGIRNQEDKKVLLIELSARLELPSYVHALPAKLSGLGKEVNQDFGLFQIN